MKIAIHQPRISYYFGGGERVPLEQARYLSRLGHHVTIVTTKTARPSALFMDFVRKNPSVHVELVPMSTKLKVLHRIVPGHSRARWDDESLEFGRLTEDYYWKNKFDLVAIHYTVDALRIPDCQTVALQLHGCPKRRRNIDALALKRSDVLLSVARYVTNFWRRMYQIKKPILLAYNGINASVFCPRKISTKYDLFFAGRLIKIKGVDDLLRAVGLATERFPELKLLIVGRGPDEERLKALAVNLGIAGNICWAGSVSDEALLSAYRSSRVSVFPSTAKEGVLTTMLEAAACGAAVITTNSCGMPEFLKNKKNGLLVAPGDPKSLTDAILLLLDNPALAGKLGANARRAIVQSWTWEKRAADLSAIYKNVVKK
ncbi:MAG: glycosyltransferase family 4 protein [bacterium]|nr:glycosyltransferase family 4 protein [bacterium]